MCYDFNEECKGPPLTLFSSWMYFMTYLELFFPPNAVEFIPKKKTLSLSHLSVDESDGKICN